MINILFNGAAGRMGKTLIGLIAKDPGLKLVGATEKSDNPNVGKDAGEVAGIGKVGVKISANLEEALPKCNVVIDFSHANAAPTLLEAAHRHKKPLIIGTTGHDNEQKALFEKFSRAIPLFVSPNMSVGVNLLWKLTEMAANTLGDRYQINIVERHHIHKKDAPSGTAKKMIEIVTTASGHDIDKDVFYNLSGEFAEQTDKPISVQAIREGEIVGEHTIFFTSREERIEIAHHAFTREIFGSGAIRAVKWVVDKPAGLYDMQDVLFFN